MAVPMPKMHQDNPTYFDQTGEWRVTFYPLKDGEVPGFTHRVVINCRSAGWLAQEFRPSGRTAAYFLSEFGPYIESQLQEVTP